MAAKKKVEDGVSLSVALPALDRKNRSFRRDQPEEKRSKVNNYLMLKYASAVSGSKDMEAYYLMAAQENANANFFDLNKHPDLQWLTLTTVSPGMGVMRHYWPGAPTSGSKDELYDIVAQLRPQDKKEDIELWLRINQRNDVENWILEHGAELPKKKKK